MTYADLDPSVSQLVAEVISIIIFQTLLKGLFLLSKQLVRHSEQNLS